MVIEMTERERLNQEAVATMLSGRQVHLFEPRPEEFDVRDVAKGLSTIARYNGQTIKPYWVGDHSVLVARIFMRMGDLILARYGLLHDGAEAVYHDMVHPFKYMPEMAAYKKLEKKGQIALYKRYGLREEPEEVKNMDLLLVNNEKRDLRNGLGLDKNAQFFPDVTITPWGPEKTEREFLKTFNELFGEEFGVVEIP